LNYLNLKHTSQFYSSSTTVAWSHREPVSCTSDWCILCV